MNPKSLLWTALLTLLCVLGSVAGIVLGFIVGCVISMFLVSILQPPGTAYDYYSVGTPLGNVVILGPIAIGAAAPWIAFARYLVRTHRRGKCLEGE